MEESYRSVLPREILEGLDRLPKQEDVQELRLRCGQYAAYANGIGEWILPVGSRGFPVDAPCLQQIMNKAAGYSTYASADQLRQGFLTLPGGHRLGICGQAVMCPDGVQTLRNISSLNLRIAKKLPDVGQDLAPVMVHSPVSTLIAGPPGCGKTTLLRALIRICSETLGERVGVVDERMELGACAYGMPGFSLGSHTDILSGTPKETGIYMLLRTMRPQWIAVDEITRAEDVTALMQCAFCGVKLLASAHIFSKEDLNARPLYAKMCRLGIFDQMILMDKHHHYTVERMNTNDQAVG